MGSRGYYAVRTLLRVEPKCTDGFALCSAQHVANHEGRPVAEPLARRLSKSLGVPLTVLSFRFSRPQIPASARSDVASEPHQGNASFDADQRRFPPLALLCQGARGRKKWLARIPPFLGADHPIERESKAKHLTVVDQGRIFAHAVRSWPHGCKDRRLFQS